jgi:S1-C subfamily serine protease
MFHMAISCQVRQKSWRLILIPFLCAALIGCAHLATPREKADSFKPFAAHRIGDLALRDYIEARTALLVAGAKPLGVDSSGDQLGVGLKPTDADGKVDLGSAVAISTDGYFLTANHCIHRRPIFLVVPEPGGPKAVPARVVWQPPSTPAGDDCDLAILHISAALPSAFELADNSQVALGDPVITAGVNGAAGGRLISATPTDAVAAAGLPYTFTLIHDIPLTHGDSGGPLTTLDGKLIGVDVLVRGVYIGPRQGVALRPDPKWLMQRMDEDRRENISH